MQNSDFQRFSVILPTFNEAENIEKMTLTLLKLYPGIRILVMDDNSQDETISICKELEKTIPQFRIFVRDPKDKGLTASAMEGIVRSETEFYIVMDSDFQHPPEILKALMEKLLDGADMVIGKRSKKDALSMGRRFSSDVAQCIAAFYLTFISQPRSKDIMSGLFGGRTETCRRVINEKNDEFERVGFKILFDMLKFIDPKSKISEVEYEFGSRAGGESKINSTIIVSVLRQCGTFGKSCASIADVVLSKK